MSPPLVVPPALTIYTVADTARAWRDRLDDGDAALALEAGEVVEIDAAGVQLLVSLANALRQRGRPLRLASPSPALAAACTRLGAGFVLETPVAPEAGA